MSVTGPGSFLSPNNRVYVRDYKHASNVFRSNSYENAPRLKFLYHVYFTINVSQIPALARIYNNNASATIGLLVKSIQLPGFDIETETLNQYNRKRIVQKKVTYRPVAVELHDDSGDKIRQLWYNYFSYYYKDPTHPYDNVSTSGSGQAQLTDAGYNSRDIYSANRATSNWGFVGESVSDSTGPGTNTGGKPPFFRDIKIYGFDKQTFAEYVLINPVIKNWEHDTYDYSDDGGTMANRLSIEFETVKYYSGRISESRPDTNVNGFADPSYYDQNSGSVIYGRRP